MKRDLYGLTREDWNALFPVELVDHDPAWSELFEQEKGSILHKLGQDTALRIEHFGSTSIPGIKAKPYIDIILAIPATLLFDEGIITRLRELGYTYFMVPAREGIDAYMSFGKGYHLDGEKGQIYHIHMCPMENIMWKQLAFRDYLISHPERAQAYEALKMELATRYRNDRGAYVLSKTDFVNYPLPKGEGAS